ncbi:hypothetical protein ACHAPE_001929 [Trichoderma viride]
MPVRASLKLETAGGWVCDHSRLLFSPTRWAKDIKYSRDPEYQLRYISNARGSWRQLLQCSGSIQLKGPAQGCCPPLFYLTTYRRSTPSSNIDSSRYPWLGYFDIEQHKPDSLDTETDSVQDVYVKTI